MRCHHSGERTDRAVTVAARRPAFTRQARSRVSVEPTSAAPVLPPPTLLCGRDAGRQEPEGNPLEVQSRQVSSASPPPPSRGTAWHKRGKAACAHVPAMPFGHMRTLGGISASREQLWPARADRDADILCHLIHRPCCMQDTDTVGNNAKRVQVVRRIQRHQD